ncbi:MAG: superoxide dismutase [Candidatus Staskawiczbacteria bacterium]|nr:superoxide dismutase [Candidatus Staskawiczbacteria bacterium]
MEQVYKLPELDYDYNGLEPYISEEIMTLHHQKHHKSYVDNANILLDKISLARKNNEDLDVKSILKSLSFNVAGHVLHSIFWKTMAPANSEKNEPGGSILEKIEKEFGSFDRFKKEFSQAAVSVEGSGWAVLTYDKTNDKLLLMQVEKHNLNFYPEHKILLLLDVWEHSYYLDYKSDRPAFVEAFWNIINWLEVEKRLEA